MKLANIAFLFFFFIAPLHAQHKEEGHHDEGGHGHHGHGSSKAIGPGKAILEVHEEKGFKLSEEATRTIGIKLTPLQVKSVEVPEEALVVSKDQKGVYLLRNGFYNFAPVKSFQKTSYGFLISLEEQKKEGDQVVVGGVGLLRVADIYSTDESEYGHGH